MRSIVVLFVILLFAPLARAQGFPADSRYFLMARDGSQCRLQSALDEEIALELLRFKRDGLPIDTDGIWISWMLRPDHLPEGCVPPDAKAVFKKYPWSFKAIDSRPVTCEACGCPETWYYCVLSGGRPEDLKEMGYAPLGRPN